MSHKPFLSMLVVLILAVGLAGCKLPASTAPAPTPTVGEGGFPVPGETMGLFETFATQTAMAQQGGAPGVEVTPTAPPAPLDTGPQEPEPQATEPPPAEPQATEPPPPEPAAPTPEPVVVPPPTPGLPETYILQRDEFPFCIARRFDLNPADLLSANGLTQNSRVFPGDTLRIPQSARPFPGDRALRSHPTNYTVQSGDSIYKVACAFGDVDPMVIAQVNGLSEPYTLSAGQTLQIP